MPLEKDREKTGINEAVRTGIGQVNGLKAAVAIMDATFRMGSMGSVVGEKITRAIEKADELSIPFIIYYFICLYWTGQRNCNFCWFGQV